MGKAKIRYALKAKGISDYCIRKGLASIDVGDYERVLEKLSWLKRKKPFIRKNLFTKKAKIRQHLLQKGFEADLVDELIKKAFNVYLPWKSKLEGRRNVACV